MRFLALTFDGAGNLPPLLGLIEALVAAGHSVDVLGHDTQRERIVAVGGRFVGFERAEQRDSGAAGRGLSSFASIVAGRRSEASATTLALIVGQLWEGFMSNCRAARAIAAAIVVAAASLPTLSYAQGAPLKLPDPATHRSSIEDQLRDLNVKLASEIRARQISPANAEIIQRELNEVQAQRGDAQDVNGGHATLSERFDLQAQLDKIADEISKDTVGPGGRAAP